MIRISNVLTDFGDYVQQVDHQNLSAQDKEIAFNMYKADFALSADGDFLESGGKFVIAEGLANLAQSLTLRLTTDRGTHPMNPSLGVPWSEYIGATYASKEIVQLELGEVIMDEIYKDPRVREVSYLNVEFIDNNVVAIDIQIQPEMLGLAFRVQRVGE